MKIKEVRAEYGLTIGLKNYSSFKLGTSMTATLEAGEDPQKAQAELFELCRQEVTRQAEAGQGDSAEESDLGVTKDADHFDDEF